MEECLARWVSCESPSRHPEALEAMASLLVGESCPLDLPVRRTLGGQLLMVGPCGQQPGRQLLLGHFDTVWPPGSLASMPVRVEEGRLFGPGCYDMKAGICLILFALRCLQALRTRDDGFSLREIVVNAGDEASVVVNKVLEGKGNFGFNAANHAYGDMIEMGILDPTKVTRTALQNAASVASLMLTTEVMVAEAPKDDAPMGMPPGMGGMGGMDGMM